MSRELASRLVLGPIFAITAIGLILGDAWLPGSLGVTILAALVVILSGWEYARLLRPFAPGIQALPIIVVGLLLVADATPLVDWPRSATLHADPAMLLLGCSLVWVCLSQMARHGLDHFLSNVGLTLFGILYIGVANHLLLALASIDTPHAMRGHQLLILVISACKLGDTSAYFGGRAFGRTKLCPSISPGKTRAGFVASLIGNVAGVYLVHSLFLLATGSGPLLTWWHGVIWGLVVGPVGALGDLLESCLKRSVDAKDSSNLLPGFGGFLDVFDAVLLAAPIGCLLAVVL